MTRSGLSTTIAVVIVVVLVAAAGVGYYTLVGTGGPPTTTSQSSSSSSSSSSSTSSSSSVSSSSSSSSTTSTSSSSSSTVSLGGVTCTSDQTVQGTVTVMVTDFMFGNPPHNVSISAGQSVQWAYDPNGKFHHTVVSDVSGLFQSGFIEPGQKFTCTFSQAGTFAYHCSVHPLTMKGNVIVT